MSEQLESLAEQSTLLDQAIRSILRNEITFTDKADDEDPSKLELRSAITRIMGIPEKQATLESKYSLMKMALREDFLETHDIGIGGLNSLIESITTKK